MIIANIIGNTGKDDVVVVGGREFKRVKNGLDEAQVIAFINELIKEKSELIKEKEKLAKAQEHITSLSRLAERTVVEADKLATQIKAEASEQAKAESAAIIDKAKEQARQLMEKKIAEAVEIANEKANAIRAKAEEEAALLLQNERNKIREQLRNFINQQINYLLERVENLKQQALAVQADFGEAGLQPQEERGTIAVAMAEKKDASVVDIPKEFTTVVVEAEKKVLEQRLEPSPAVASVVEKSLEIPKLLQIEQQPELGKPQWEVEISPPFNISKVMEVVAYLDQLPQVASTEMIVPQIDMPSILVFLRSPLNLVDTLKTISAVAYVEEVATIKSGSEGKPFKVRIGFSENPASSRK